MELVGDVIDIYYIECPACGRRYISFSKKQLYYMLLSHLRIHGINMTPQDLKSLKIKSFQVKVDFSALKTE